MQIYPLEWMRLPDSDIPTNPTLGYPTKQGHVQRTPLVAISLAAGAGSLALLKSTLHKRSVPPDSVLFLIFNLAYASHL
jgi:hypothetical protein